MRINSEGWYPCYLNPDFEEIVELAKSQWDTCRILANPDNNDFLIASGYGNCHSSMAERYKIHCKRKRPPMTDPYILFHENRIAFFNLEDVSGERKARFETWKQYFTKEQVEILKDLIRESDLAL